MKLRKSWPSISVSTGRMIVHSIPRRPDASPERKTVTASTHSATVIAELPSVCVACAESAAGPCSRRRRGRSSTQVVGLGLDLLRPSTFRADLRQPELSEHTLDALVEI